ncbi:hypothetical protein K0O13_08145 [Mammaliicoccus sciuri]|uniref:hypothetical protein n=1 Tax=Mammaliicoccus sciuri TaxID=1296 RepID=UPI001C633EDC|nr:hypothetical protein [Mammaliicoccus sciuri]QYG30071.1 hypothetical protein K0O13_08145 [Mammaliicoccus sciuri]
MRNEYIEDIENTEVKEWFLEQEGYSNDMAAFVEYDSEIEDVKIHNYKNSITAVISDYLNNIQKLFQYDSSKIGYVIRKITEGLLQNKEYITICYAGDVDLKDIVEVLNELSITHRVNKTVSDTGFAMYEIAVELEENIHEKEIFIF